jgi:predicted amidohydrolase
MRFKIALLQITPEENNIEFNQKKGIEFCKKAMIDKPDLILFPEIFSIGYTLAPTGLGERKKWENQAIDLESQYIKDFQSFAKENKVNIAITYLEKYSPKPRNAVSIIDMNGEIVMTYAKVFICNFGLEELNKSIPNINDLGSDYNCTAGKDFPVVEIQNKNGEKVNVGAMICADREFPEAATNLTRNGAEIILVPNACEWDPARAAILKTRAFENMVEIAMASYPAPKGNGQSCAFDPMIFDRDGNYRESEIERADDSEQILTVEFDVDAIREFRKAEQWRWDYRFENPL